MFWSILKKIKTLLLKGRTLIIILVLLLLAGSLFYCPFFVKNKGIEFFSSGYDSFGNEKWIVDKKTGIAMSFENNTNDIYDYFSVRYSSLKNGYIKTNGGYNWVGEYFCQPDSIVILKGINNKYIISYLPYLNWRKDFFISSDGSFGRVSAIKAPLSGKLGFLNKVYLDRISDLNLEIRRDSSMFSGKNFRG